MKKSLHPTKRGPGREYSQGQPHGRAMQKPKGHWIKPVASTDADRADWKDLVKRVGRRQALKRVKLHRTGLREEMS